MCPHCNNSKAIIKKSGFYSKKCGRSPRIQRYFCHSCKKSFSNQTATLTFRDQKPHVYSHVFRLACSSMSQRRMAELLNLHRDTVARKIKKLAREARRQTQMTRPSIKAEHVIFDEMETFEHSKCKPLTIAVAVDEKSRRILSLDVAQMSPKGHLVEIARKRYGRRPDRRKFALRKMVIAIKESSPGLKTLKSDESPRYAPLVKRHFPKIHYQQFKGRRGCVVGQGELKAGGRDPLFALNHTCAMVRDNLKRLSRRTWCTTKKPERLQDLLDLYQWFHNKKLTGNKRPILVG